MMREHLGEEQWKALRQYRQLQRRGLENLPRAFRCASFVWQRFLVQQIRVIDEEKKPREERIAEYEALNAKVAKISAHYRGIIDSEVMDLAPSPEALKLEKKAESIYPDLEKRLISQGPDPIITEEDLKEVDRLADEFLKQIKPLPRLTKEQMQAEVKALPKEEVHR